MKQQTLALPIALFLYRSIMDIEKRDADVGGAGGRDDVARSSLLSTEYCLLSAKKSSLSSKLLGI